MKRSAVSAFATILSCLQVSMAAEPSIGLTVLNSMARISQHEAPFGQAAAEISAARNEVESFQVVVAAPQESLTVIGASISDLTGPQGARIAKENVTIYREEYVRVRMSTPAAPLPPGLYPDPLVPVINPLTGEPIEPLNQRRERWGEPLVKRGFGMFALPFDVFKGQNQPLWLDVRVPKDATPGQYQGTLQLKARINGHGRQAELPVTLTVWDFALPDGPTHRNHFGNFNRLASLFNVQPGSDKAHEIEARYCQSMAEHRLTPPLPSHLLPTANPDGSLNIDPSKHEALRTFINDLHITDFEIPVAPFARLPRSTLTPNYKDIPPDQREKAQRYYRQYYEYVKANGWEKRAYVYLLDEPNLKENYEQVLVLGQMIHEAVPQLRLLVVEQTYVQDPAWPDIGPAVDIWCPLWGFIDRDSIRARIAEGDEVWSYTALVQRAPPYHPKYAELRDKDPAHWHIDWPLLTYRVPTWVNRQYDITGLLYWTTVETVIDPWLNPAFAHPRHYNGGGLLFYPGTPCGMEGPVTSMRLKNLRDGMEDYEYFALLEQRAGAAAVKEVVDRIAPNWWDYSRDPEAILAARRELAQRILAAPRQH